MTESLLGARDRRALLVAAVVVAPVLAVRLAIRPYTIATGALRDRIGVERRLLARELAVLGDAAAMPSLQSAAQSRWTATTPRLFTAEGDVAATGQLLNYVTDLARRHRVLIQRVDGREAKPVSSRLVALSVELRGVSDLEGVLAFLGALEAGPKLVRVESVAVQGGGSGGTARSDDVLAVSATVTGYRAGPASPSGNGPEAAP